ncbi:MAG: DUF1015 domain-containing protein [Candidatus Hydrogenedentes bacterium]|nr:DUF1015 domain-containing protein [Candidatus Hydrogenedentota bacterium]
MPEVKPFHGLRFNPSVAGNPDDLITPPYDVISPAERAELTARNPHNIAHLLLPETVDGLDKYAVAAEILEAWIGKGVLATDADPGYYLLHQHFTDLQGMPRVRRAFFAVTKLPEEGERIILGHERTFSKPVEDRLRLTEATKTNLGAVFVLYNDGDGALLAFLDQAEQRPPDLEAVTIDGTRQQLWRVDPDPAVAAFLADQTLYIADGHHRFKTAVTYRDSMREKQPNAGPQAYDYVLMGFVSFDDPGLAIYPPHRVVSEVPEFDAEAFIAALEEYFEIIKVPADLVERVNSDEGLCVMGLVVQGKGEYVLRLREDLREKLLATDHGPAWRDLDVAVLHRGILENLLGLPEGTEFAYEKSAPAALAAANEGGAVLAFILRAVKPEQIRACAEAGEAMPQKSTYFFPKLPSGAVMYRLV